MDLAWSLASTDGGDILDGRRGACLIDPEPPHLGREKILPKFVVFNAADNIGNMPGIDGDNNIASANLERYGCCGLARMEPRTRNANISCLLYQ